MIWLLVWLTGVALGAVAAWAWLRRPQPGRPIEAQQLWDLADQIDEGALSLEELARIRAEIERRQRR